jgi:hypothetical protein
MIDHRDMRGARDLRFRQVREDALRSRRRPGLGDPDRLGRVDQHRAAAQVGRIERALHGHVDEAIVADIAIAVGEGEALRLPE